MRAQYMADAAAFADRFSLPPEQREALITLDMPSIVKMGAHPLAPFLAQLQIQRGRDNNAAKISRWENPWRCRLIVQLRPIRSCAKPSQGATTDHAKQLGPAHCHPGPCPRASFKFGKIEAEVLGDVWQTGTPSRLYPR
jgi:hypothetical protein